MAKNVTKVGPVCGECNGCMCFTLIAGIILIALSWLYVTVTWVKWVLIIIGILLVLKKWCPCKRKAM